MPPLSLPGETIVQGDGKSASIAAASILAKVSRDRILRELGRRYPEYGFEKHKGYGTKVHYAAVKALEDAISGLQKPADPDTPTDPEKPTDPDTPADPEKPTDETPEEPETPTTSDNNMMVIYAGLLLLSAMVMVVLFKKRRQEH